MSDFVLVTGGRNFRDRGLVWDWLDHLHDTRDVWGVIHGACDDGRGNLRGADRWADEWATARGVEVTRCPAEWNRHGAAAGPIRNREMLKYQPTLVLAFPGGAGTADMVRHAKRAGVPVIEVGPAARPPSGARR